MRPVDLTSEIIAYECGLLDEEGVLALFQALVDNGMAWTLQGHYGRTAAALIEAGLIAIKPGSRRQRAIVTSEGRNTMFTFTIKMIDSYTGYTRTTRRVTAETAEQAKYLACEAWEAEGWGVPDRWYPFITQSKEALDGHAR